MLRFFLAFNAVISLMRNIRTIIGLIILAIIIGFVYILVTNDFDVMLAFNQITERIQSIYYAVKDWIKKIELYGRWTYLRYK